MIGLEQDGDQYSVCATDAWDPTRHTLGAYRPVQPLKALFFRPRVLVSAPAVEESAAPAEQIVIGVKNCDLSALRIHDHVFRDTAPPDPFYCESREKTILVSVDCTDALDVCFCTAVGEPPYAVEGFDINLSPLETSFVVESGTERGAELLRATGNLLQPVDKASLDARDKTRAAMCDRVRDLAAAEGLAEAMDFRSAVQETSDAPLWEEFAETCVECGACNFICCTCHCFLLADGRTREGAVGRTQQWDSCLYRNFAGVAGGANPRSHRAERLFNRFEKKFSFFPAVLNQYACDGCGRCVEACTGRIDIRQVLKRAVDER